MKIVIIGSVNGEVNQKRISSCADWNKKNVIPANDLELILPSFESEENMSFEKILRKREQYLEHIKTAHLIIVCSKEDGSFGESTTYELAFARHFIKNVMIFSKELENKGGKHE